MTDRAKIQHMLDIEESSIAFYAKEVTVDFPAVRAEIRCECLKDVLKALDRKEA